MIVLQEVVTASCFFHLMSHNRYDLKSLIKKYDTPLMLFDQDVFESRLGEIEAALGKVCGDFRIYYAAKAFFNTGLGKLLNKLGLYLDASSYGEIYVALKSGFDPARINYHGHNKKEEELRLALKAGVATVTVDSIEELATIQSIARDLGRVQEILIRVNPGVSVHTDEKIRTGCSDSKFGIPYERIESVFVDLKKYPNLKFVGLHCHVGSQIFETAPYLEAAQRLFDLFLKAHREGFPVRLFNLGGGFGITYKDETPFPTEELTRVASFVKEKAQKSGIQMPVLCFEPGRFLAGPSGTTLYTIGTIKEVPQRTYLSVDGGLFENPRPALYGAVYDAYVLERGPDAEKAMSYRVCGRTCESDVLIPEIKLAKARVGDHLVVSNTGAYNYSMSSNYNQYPRPAVVLLHDGKDGLLVAREEYEDLTRKDQTPDWLA